MSPVHKEYHDRVLSFIEQNPHKNIFKSLPFTEAFLRESFSNYRNSCGFCLSRNSFNFTRKYDIFCFHEFTRPQVFDSRFRTTIEKFTKSPYYIGSNKIYVADDDFAFHLTLCGDDWSQLKAMLE